MTGMKKHCNELMIYSDLTGNKRRLNGEQPGTQPRLIPG